MEVNESIMHTRQKRINEVGKSVRIILVLKGANKSDFPDFTYFMSKQPCCIYNLNFKDKFSNGTK